MSTLRYMHSMRHFIIILTMLLVCGIRELSVAQWATSGQFSSINSSNGDGLYPASINAVGDARFSIGANWTGGKSDLSLINSNISSGGVSFWQMTGANAKKMLVYMRNDGYTGIGTTNPEATLHVDGDQNILTTGAGAGFRFRDRDAQPRPDPWADDWIWYSKGSVARFFRPGIGDIMGITATGNVGIGTMNPATKLDVRGGQTSVDYLNVYPQNNANGEGGEISLKGSSGNPNWQMDVFDNTFRFHTNGTVPLQIFPNGNVSASGNLGVGTATPSTKLHVVTGGVTIGNNIHTSNVNGHLSIGDLTSSDEPTPSTWTNKTTFIINAQTYSTIGFADGQNRRVDYIRAGSGTIELGYDAGWGRANIGLANGIWRNDGNVGIGTTNPGTYKLAVEGKIGAREVEVKVGSWADFVFQPGYQLRPLSKVADYIASHKHLPEIPSEAEVKEYGIGLGEMNAKLLQKIEELTLYVIDLKREIEELKRKGDNQMRSN